MGKKKIRLVMALTVAGLLLIFMITAVLLGISSNDQTKQMMVTGLVAAVQSLVGGLIGTVCGFYFTDTEEKDESGRAG